MLAVQAARRHLSVAYRLVEERAPTSMHAAYFVSECTLAGTWNERDPVSGKLVKYVGPRSYQGIGKTTRDAKLKATGTPPDFPLR